MAQELSGMWDLPGPGIESVSPALAGGFLPGKSLCLDRVKIATNWDCFIEDVMNED